MVCAVLFVTLLLLFSRLKSVCASMTAHVHAGHSWTLSSTSATYVGAPAVGAGTAGVYTGTYMFCIRMF